VLNLSETKKHACKEPASVEAKELVTRAWKRGVLIITGGMSTVRMAPPLIINKGQEIFETTAREITQEKLKSE